MSASNIVTLSRNDYDILIEKQRLLDEYDAGNVTKIVYIGRDWYTNLPIIESVGGVLNLIIESRRVPAEIEIVNEADQRKIHCLQCKIKELETKIAAYKKGGFFYRLFH